MYDGQEELDNLVWDKNDEDSEEATKRMRLKTTCRQVELLAAQLFGKPATLISPLFIGGFNILYRVRVDGVSPDVIVRLPCPSLVQFPDEKIVQEAGTAVCILKSTEIPLPRVLFYGRESMVGPFVILQFIENNGSMSARLNTPNDDPSIPHVLNPDVTEDTLDILWGQVARYYLQLSRMTFPRIGSVAATEKNSYSVVGRPITHNMTDMVRLANIPRIVLPSEGQTYATADGWYIALAEMHISQLIFQHNDSVSSEDDCRNKYVARQIFRRLAKQGRLSTFGFADDKWSAQSSKINSSTLSPAPSGSDSFRLWSDDLRAGNILLDKSDNIASIIDWEFAYAGPTQFILDPPWWLLLELAETWPSGIESWRETYELRLKTWLSAVERAESTTEIGPLPVPLSTYMRQSWETGRFWLNYGARKSWAFDAIYWRYLDERFFGARPSETDNLWESRIHLLSEAERHAMEPFVKRKMEESKDRIIVDWDPVEATQRLAELLFD
ncbi:phosphotransferase [Phlyctema vagabunda]|uniref:Phosphotransferase n=1 Tax=Phlyctema vagabunda TaxID=108571 RepID=A0ABR4P9Z8_9HELO